MGRLRLAVLISGRGSNLQALLEACARPGWPAEVALVVSNNAGAGGLAHAARAGVPTAVIDHRGFPDRVQFDAALDRRLSEAGAELVCLAGFMRLLTPAFVDRWRDRLVNIHPSLLPAFRGLDTHARVLTAGARFSGCTVHFVRHEVDSGPIIAQAAVPVHPDDTPDSLAARVLAAEHRLYPMVVRLIAEGRVRVAGERVVIAGVRAPEEALLNPCP